MYLAFHQRNEPLRIGPDLYNFLISSENLLFQIVKRRAAFKRSLNFGCESIEASQALRRIAHVRAIRNYRIWLCVKIAEGQSGDSEARKQARKDSGRGSHLHRCHPGNNII
jgi:hypothetical protein